MKSRLVFFIGLMFLLVACDSLVFNRADIKATYEIGYMHAIIDMDKSGLNRHEFVLEIDKHMKKASDKYMNIISK